MQSVWRIQPPQPQRASALAVALGLHPITAQLLLNRGLATPAEAKRFLSPSLQALMDPWTLPDMRPAVSRLKRAVAEREPIVLFGDSDVDGLTAGRILYEALQGLGAVIRAYPANRIVDGYGVPQRLIQRWCRSATKLALLVDCGTNQPEAVSQLAACGIDTIIVDHHVPLEGWAKPLALINPFGVPARHHRELSSAGLAFKIVQALYGADAAEPLAAVLDLAALGTLADCSPLRGESRTIVAEGLARIVTTRRPGLRRLCEATKTTEPDPEQILRRLVPRLNASGRLGDCSAVWGLLQTGDAPEAEEWLASAEAAHTQTKGLHRQLIGEAQAQVNRLHFRDQYVMVVSGIGWPRGLMGPLASQLAQRYGRPAIAIAMDEDHGTGSGRSIPLFDLLEALKACQELLVRFGGHAQACGLTLSRRRLDAFRALVNEQARRVLGQSGLLRARMVDLELPLEAVVPQWIQEAERFAPFGQGNPRPLVAIRGLTIDAVSPRRAVLSDGMRRLEGRGDFQALGPERYDLVASPALADGEPVLSVHDVKVSQAPGAPVPTAGTPYTRGSA